MKKLGLILVLALCLVGIAGQASAGETATIIVTVTLNEIISVGLDQLSWNIGGVVLGVATAQFNVIATNDGNVNIDLNIKGTDAANGWVLSNNPGLANNFVVSYQDASPSLFPILKTDTEMETAVAPAGTVPFDLSYRSPDSDTQGPNLDHSFSITVTASKTP